MSRSRKGGKGPGYEYWSRRPYSRNPPSAMLKKATHRVERLEAKKIVRKQREGQE